MMKDKMEKENEEDVDDEEKDTKRGRIKDELKQVRK